METLDYKIFEKWLELYKKAWEERNPDFVNDLYAENAVCQETPYSGRYEGLKSIKRYWEEGARDSQMHVKFSYDIITVKGSRGFAKWNAEFDRVGKKIRVELDGVMEVVFNDEFKAETFNEWWHRKEIKP